MLPILLSILLGILFIYVGWLFFNASREEKGFIWFIEIFASCTEVVLGVSSILWGIIFAIA